MLIYEIMIPLPWLASDNLCSFWYPHSELIFISLKGGLNMKQNDNFFMMFERKRGDVSWKYIFVSSVGVSSELIPFIWETFFQYFTTLLCSCPSTNVLSSWQLQTIHLCAISPEIFLGNPGSNFVFERPFLILQYCSMNIVDNYSNLCSSSIDVIIPKSCWITTIWMYLGDDK